MIKTRNVNKTTRLMGLTIMRASKNFKSQRLQRIFGRSNIIFEDFCETQEQLGMSGYLASAAIYLKGYSCGKELLGSRHKVFSEQ